MSSPTRISLVILLLAAGFMPSAHATDTGASKAPSAPPDDARYLHQLGLMRGHLLVGHRLFQEGERAAARAHSKHPADELYASLLPAFAERGVRGFSTELTNYADAVENGGEAAVRDAHYEAVVNAIHRHEQAVQTRPHLSAQVVVELVRTAAREYAAGIVDGKPADAHEYQDAFGFTRIALWWSQRAAAAGHEEFERIAARLQTLDDMWPKLAPPPSVPHSASRLYGAAAEIEILTLRLAGR